MSWGQSAVVVNLIQGVDMERMEIANNIMEDGERATCNSKRVHRNYLHLI